MNLIVRSNLDNASGWVESLRATVAAHLERETDIDDSMSRLEIVIEELLIDPDGLIRCRIAVAGEVNGVDASDRFSSADRFADQKTCGVYDVGLLAS